jgi:hypothetical protein
LGNPRGANPDLGAYESGITLTVTPPNRAIPAGNVATYTVGVSGNAGGAAVSLITVSPSPSLTLQLIPNSVTPPGQATLIVTDTHPTGPLVPGQWFSIPITGTGGGLTQTVSASLLVGGVPVNLPVILKQ